MNAPRRRWLVGGVVVAAAAVALMSVAVPLIRDAGHDDEPIESTNDAAVHSSQAHSEQGGVHRRLRSPRGPIHVWQPAQLRPRDAAIVVYVHGFGTPIDTAWHRQRLASQFAASRLNALFIAPATRLNNREPVRWLSLKELLSAVEQASGVDTSTATRVVAVGHSGAFRTIAGWLAHPRLDRIVLLDALYSAAEDYGRWLSRPNKRMVMVAKNTVELGEPFQRKHGAQVLDAVPGLEADLRPDPARALIYVRSQFSHMGIVTSQKVIPVVLRWVDVATL